MAASQAILYYQGLLLVIVPIIVSTRIRITNILAVFISFSFQRLLAFSCRTLCAAFSTAILLSNNCSTGNNGKKGAVSLFD